jgi:hypothetical protein
VVKDFAGSPWVVLFFVLQQRSRVKDKIKTNLK